jgi:hypothetical protein
MNVEHEMYDYSGNNGSHRNSNEHEVCNLKPERWGLLASREVPGRKVL